MRLNHRQRKARAYCTAQRDFFEDLYLETLQKQTLFAGIASYNSYVKWNERSNRYYRLAWS